MKISFENPDKINGLLTIVVEEEDYKNDVEKTLKDYRKKANVPGFRPGQAPRCKDSYNEPAPSLHRQAPFRSYLNAA